jgi:hypothetical protein
MQHHASELRYQVMWQLRVLCWNLGDGESLITELSAEPLPEQPEVLMQVLSRERPELRPIQASVLKGIVAVDAWGHVLSSRELSVEQEAWLCDVSRQLLLPVIEPI